MRKQTKEAIDNRECVYLPAFVYIMHRIDLNATNRISIATGLTYSHTHNVLKGLGKRGFLRFDRNGRENNIELTSKGKELKEWADKGFYLLEGKDK